MVAVVICPSPVLQFEDRNGVPLSGGLLFTYAGGTTNKTATYTDSTGLVPNTNPIVLNSQGEAPGAIFVPPSTNIKFVLAPVGSSDPPTAPIWTVDNVAAGPTLAGTMSLQDSANVNIVGGTVSIGTLTVTGATQLSTLTVSSIATLKSNLSVTGTSTFGGAATFSGPVTISANVNINASTVTISPTASSNTAVQVQSFSAGFGATVFLQTGASSRWAFYKDSMPESGSNVGSDLRIDAYSDSGALISTSVKVTRATGLVTLGSLFITSSGGLTMAGQINGAGASTATLTNSPVAGNAFWIPVTVNGFTGWIPFWHT